MRQMVVVMEVDSKSVVVMEVMMESYLAGN
jgi:hypothetical protein